MGRTMTEDAKAHDCQCLVCTHARHEGIYALQAAPHESIVDVREATHGDFRKVAALYVALRTALRNATLEVTAEITTQPALPAALDMILMKLARIACGDPNHPDHWRDISGYAELVLRILEARPDAEV